MSTTAIEWADATWNPVVGCSIVSPGCTNCYAMKMAARIQAMGVVHHYDGTTKGRGKKAVWTGKIFAAPDKTLHMPLGRFKPLRIFVNSMGDLFHEDVPDEWIDRAFAVMALCPQHTFQALTKRAERMWEYCSDPQASFRVARAMDEIAARRDTGLEEVRPIASYPGYFASSHGHIYSERRGRRRRMSPDIAEQGHQRVTLYRGTVPATSDRLLVHRIILETFVGPPPSPDAQGRHGDGVPSNNAVSNLSWGDQGENWADSKRHGSHRRYSKLTPEQAAAIRSRHASGETGEALAREFDISATQVRNIASGKQWAVESPIEWPLRNCWLGISAERQQEADERIPHLLQTPAAVRFVSYEPALGPIDFNRVSFGEGDPRHKRDTLTGQARMYGTGINGHPDVTILTEFATPMTRLDWIIAGSESGSSARPFALDWFRAVERQCRAAGTSFFMKQITEHGRKVPFEKWPADLQVRQFPEARP